MANYQYKYLKYQYKLMNLLPTSKGYLKVTNNMMGGTSFRKHLSQPWFDLIKNGTKEYEGRIYDGDWSQMKVGDKITFYNDVKEYDVNIKEIKKFDSFKSGIESVGLEKVLPTEVDNSVDEAIKNVYYKFYSPKNEKKFGIGLFKFEVVKEK